MTPPLLQTYMVRKNRKRKLTNLIMHCVLGVAAVSALIPLLSLFFYILSQGVPALNLDFFTQLPKPVGELGGGMANAVLGSVTLIALASAIGVPWGILIGIYLSEYDKSGSGNTGRLNTIVRFSADLLSSIPSIIIGLFIYILVVVPMKHFSAFAGGLALGILMIPTIARCVEETLKLVPEHIREAGLALGLPRWRVILQIVLTGSSKAIITGVMLSVARVAGETAPLLFTAFGNRFWQNGLNEPIASLPVQVYTYAVSPYEDWHRQAWAGALILVLLVFTLNVGTRFMLNSHRGVKL